MQNSISSVQVFRESNGDLNNRGDKNNAIDGDSNTWSYMTPSAPANTWFIAGFELSETSYVNQIRIAKHRPDRDYDHFNKVMSNYIFVNIIYFCLVFNFAVYISADFVTPCFRYYIRLMMGTFKIDPTVP